MTNARRRAGFAQKTKPRRLITEISFADDFQCHRAVQIDVERFVSDPHRTATQLDRFPVFARHQFIMLKSLHRLFRCRLERVLGSEDSPDSTPPARALRSMQTGQNSIAPENSLPQIGQVRLGSVFMGLTALQLRSGPRKGHESPRQSLPDLIPCGRPPRATVRCSAFATDGYVF